MSSTTGFYASPSSKHTSFNPYTPSNTSLLIEKTKASMRRSTPDSEALASSEDEQDQHNRLAFTTTPQGFHLVRRPSWLNEHSQTPQRKGSMSGSEPFSPATSHTISSGIDASTWTSPGSTIGRGHTSGTNLPWGSTIWANDSQKVPPSRLVEVLPSENPAHKSLVEESQSPSRRDSTSDAPIPFAIPLHPTLKTYRSQSYSVGQLDQESTGNVHGRAMQNTYNGRTRTGSSYAGLQHRPSRPSMLGDFLPDNSVLEQLREVEDDDGISTTSSEAGVRFSTSQARTIEQLALENAILRQQARASQASNSAPPNSHYGYQTNVLSRFGIRNISMNDSVVEEQDDESGSIEAQGPAYHRTSLFESNYDEIGYVGKNQHAPSGMLENRTLENVKKGHWQSSLGFGGIADVPQSRRHSFADVPLRNPSLNPVSGLKTLPVSSLQDISAYDASGPQLSQAENVSYFSNPLSRTSELYRPTSSSSSLHNYPIPSPPSRLHHYAHGHPPFGQLLYLVTFKAARAEFYYVQEGTGLEVNNGDLVIVEADRGTDLGTVAHKNVNWADAKDLKDRYAAEHYKWLMMFSRQGQNASGLPSSTSAITASLSRQGSAIGGMGPPGPTSIAESINVEIKPKTIKRLAQPHEIHMLREKEGNEAKAKRMCQQKVAEHHLNMEILDAEFQMDWKKLTFYYFAESYVNFNSLVTDLFKIYKTRIWMSAINPASFMSPGTGLSLSFGHGNGAHVSSRDRLGDNRQLREANVESLSTVADPSHALSEVTWSGSQAHASLPRLVAAHTYKQTLPPQHQHQYQEFPLVTLSPEYANGFYSPFRSQSPFGLQTYSNPTETRSLPHHSSGNSGNEPRSSYTDHLKAIQGLSLSS